MPILDERYRKNMANINKELRCLLLRYHEKGDRKKNKVHLQRIEQFAHWFCKTYKEGSIHRVGSKHLSHYWVDMQERDIKSFKTLRNDNTSIKLLWKALGRVKTPPAPKQLKC